MSMCNINHMELQIIENTTLLIIKKYYLYKNYRFVEDLLHLQHFSQQLPFSKRHNIKCQIYIKQKNINEILWLTRHSQSRITRYIQSRYLQYIHIYMTIELVYCPFLKHLSRPLFWFNSIKKFDFHAIHTTYNNSPLYA